MKHFQEYIIFWTKVWKLGRVLGTNECLRSHFSGEILSSSCEELRDFRLQPYRRMAKKKLRDIGITPIPNPLIF